jgi:hypothetical protein
MRANVKPFVHWAIYKGYHVRYSVRNAAQVEGTLVTPAGEQPFRYDAVSREIRLPDIAIAINEHGWELATRLLPSDPAAGPDPT